MKATRARHAEASVGIDLSDDRADLVDVRGAANERRILSGPIDPDRHVSRVIDSRFVSPAVDPLDKERGQRALVA